MLYEIDKDENQILPLETSTLSAHGFREVKHLQEWIAKNPEALGEPLLIIAKEFSGWSDTNERLDLLALDKNGALVIIENKLDDTGRDVVWQVIKYAAYCSELNKEGIINIFREYLQKQSRSEDASDLICEFLGEDSIEEVSLNTGSNQRLILVATNFSRKEVTSAILWLISKGIEAQCIKVTPFTDDNKIFLYITQIIPPPEAKDYVISMSSKDSEEKETKKVVDERKQRRLQLWEKVLDNMRQRNFELFRNISPQPDHWLDAGSGITGCPYRMIFNKKEVRVEFVMARSRSRSVEDENKQIYDFLREQPRKEGIEGRFNGRLEWNRGDGLSSKIYFANPFDSYNEENWDEIAKWLYENMKRLEEAIKPVIPEIRQFLQSSGRHEESE